MAKGKRTKRQTNVYITLLKKLKIQQLERHQKTGDIKNSLYIINKNIDLLCSIGGIHSVCFTYPMYNVLQQVLS